MERNTQLEQMVLRQTPRKDYSNAVTPTKVHRHKARIVTGRKNATALTVKMASYNDKDSTDEGDKENEEEVREDGGKPRVQMIQVRGFKLKMIDLAAYVFSFAVIGVLSLKVAFLKIVQGQGVRDAFRVVLNFFSRLSNILTNLAIAMKIKFNTYQLGNILSDSKDRVVSAIKSLYRRIIDRSKVALNSMDSPKALHKIKTGIVFLSLVALASVIYMYRREGVTTDHASLKTNQAIVAPLPSPILNSAFQMGCNENDECLIGKDLYLKLIDLVSKQETFVPPKINLSGLREELQIMIENEKESYRRSSMALETRLKHEIAIQKTNIISSITPLVRPDYSLKSSGASIDLAQTSESFIQTSFIDSFRYPYVGPDLVLQNGLEPGQCWGMKGNESTYQGTKGQVEIILARKIKVAKVRIEHAALQTLFVEGERSAPREMVVYGRDDRGKALEIAQFIFNPSSNNSSERLIDVAEMETNRVVFKVKSNWGNPKWTCLYRLAVYGTESV